MMPIIVLSIFFSSGEYCQSFLSCNFLAVLGCSARKHETELRIVCLSVRCDGKPGYNLILRLNIRLKATYAALTGFQHGYYSTLGLNWVLRESSIISSDQNWCSCSTGGPELYVIIFSSGRKKNLLFLPGWLSDSVYIGIFYHPYYKWLKLFFKNYK